MRFQEPDALGVSGTVNMAFTSPDAVCTPISRRAVSRNCWDPWRSTAQHADLRLVRAPDLQHAEQAQRLPRRRRPVALLGRGGHAEPHLARGGGDA